MLGRTFSLEGIRHSDELRSNDGGICCSHTASTPPAKADSSDVASRLVGMTKQRGGWKPSLCPRSTTEPLQFPQIAGAVAFPTPCHSDELRSNDGGICCSHAASTLPANSRFLLPRFARRWNDKSIGTVSLNLCHSEMRSGEGSVVLATTMGAGSPQPNARSSQVRLRSSMSAIFFSLRHFFISVSRAIASHTL